MVGFFGQMIPEVKSLGDDGTFEGVLSTYGNIDLVGDICEVGCFSKSLSDRGTTRQLLRDHDWSKVIGTFEVTDSADALRIKGRICLDTATGRETWSLMKFGALDGLSIGYWATKYHYDQDGVRHLDELDLREGSVVGDPANPLARIQAKSQRLAMMSRYAKCKFLTKMSPEDRDAALAELDQIDAETEDEKAEDKPEEPEKTPEDAPAEDSEEKEEPEGSPEENEEDEAVQALRAIGKTCSDLLSKLEG